MLDIFHLPIFHPIFFLCYIAVILRVLISGFNFIFYPSNYVSWKPKQEWYQPFYMAVAG